MAYRFNGLESVERLSLFLQNTTKWDTMVTIKLPKVVGLI